jgi:hypothetical protein
MRVNDPESDSNSLCRWHHYVPPNAAPDSIK